jgi:hypothetical protein
MKDLGTGDTHNLVTMTSSIRKKLTSGLPTIQPLSGEPSNSERAITDFRRFQRVRWFACRDATVRS